MMVQARATDPWTSWAAGKSVTNVREKQAVVLYILACHGEMSLSQLVNCYAHPPGADYPKQSESGIRTRCKELQDMGLVVQVGTRQNAAGRTERILAASLPNANRLF